MSHDTEALTTVVMSEVLADPGVTLDELAGRLGVSRHTITRALNKCSGASFRGTKNALRLRRMTQLISDDPRRTIKELAILVGYEHSASLSRRLKKLCGRTPTEFRSTALRSKSAAERE